MLPFWARSHFPLLRRFSVFPARPSLLEACNGPLYVITRDVSRLCQISPDGQNCSCLRQTAFIYLLLWTFRNNTECLKHSSTVSGYDQNTFDYAALDGFNVFSYPESMGRKSCASPWRWRSCLYRFTVLFLSTFWRIMLVRITVSANKKKLSSSLMLVNIFYAMFLWDLCYLDISPPLNCNWKTKKIIKISESLI